MAHTRKTLPLGVVPAALNEPQAALYVGVCANSLRAMVAKGLMPLPRAYGTRRIWLRSELDAALARLPTATISNIMAA